MIAELDHNTLGALIGATATVLAALITSVFLYLSAKFRNGKATLTAQIAAQEARIAELEHRDL